MASLFGSIGSTAFSSQIGQRIESATNPSLPSEEWALIIEICDLINETEEGPKDAIKAIRKRLSNHKNYKSILYTLTLAEACVKNCGTRFHKQIASKDFLTDLTKLLGHKEQPSNLPQVVQDKVLTLIQNWSDAFRNAPELQSIKTTYESLKAQGFEFPAQDLDTLSPIFTPGRSELAGPPPTQMTRQAALGPASNHGGPHPPMVGPINPSPEQLAKLRSELDIVDGNVTVLSQMLTELQPGDEQPNDYNLLVELNKTCREMQKRIVELLDRIANEEVTGVLLRANDDLNNVFIRYDRYERNRKVITGEVTDTPVAASQTDSKNTSSERSALIDFGDLTASPPPSQHVADDDEFDMFAQSRSTTFADSRNAGSTYDDNREGVPSEGSIAVVMSAKGPYPHPLPDKPVQPKTVEDDIEDVEEWLKGTNLATLEAEEQAARDSALKAQQPRLTVQTSEGAGSISSSEFDRFLNERALSGTQRLNQQQQPPGSGPGVAPARQMTNVAGDRTADEMFAL